MGRVEALHQVLGDKVLLTPVVSIIRVAKTFLI